MAERNLEVKLQLTSLFADAAADAAKNLESIADSLDDIGKQSSGLDNLAKTLGSIDSSIKNLSSEIGKLDAALGNSLGKIKDLTGGMSSAANAMKHVASSSSGAAEGVERVAKSAKKVGEAAQEVKATAAAVDEIAGASLAAQGALAGLLGKIDQTDMAARGMTGSMMNAARAIESNFLRAQQSLAAFREDVARTSRELRDMQGARLVDYTGPVEDRTRSLVQGVREQRMQANLPDVEAYKQKWALEAYRGIDVDYVRTDQGRAALTDSRSGQLSLSDDTSRPIPFNRPGYDPSTGLMLFSQDNQYEPTRMTFDDSLGDAEFSEKRKRGPRQYNGRSGPYINADFSVSNDGSGSWNGGPTLDELDAQERSARLAQSEEALGRAKGMYSWGDHQQSAGNASLINGMMIGDMLTGPFQDAMGRDSLYAKNESSARANDATQDTVDKLNAMATNIAVQNGGDLNDTVGSVSSFLQSMNPAVQINDPEWQKSAQFALDRASKTSIISTQAGAGISNQAVAIGANQGIANLGFDVSTPEKFMDATKQMTNALVLLANNTPSTVEQSLNFMRAVGPLAAQTGMHPEDMMGIMYALGKEKMVGSSAGNSLKRLMQRLIIPVEKTRKIQAAVRDKTHSDISLFDSQGHTRSVLDVLGQLSDADRKAHFSQKTRTQVIGQLSGLYANAPVAALYDFMQKHGGKEGLREKGHEILHAGIAGKKGDAVEGEYDVQSKTLAVQAQKTANDLKTAWDQVLTDVGPKMVSFLGFIHNIIDGFKSLPGPIRGAIETITTFGTVFLLGAGIFNVFVGNFAKTVGSLMEINLGFRGLGEEAVKGGSDMAKFGSVMSNIGNWLKGGVQWIGRLIGTFVDLAAENVVFPAMAAAAEAFAGVTVATVGSVVAIVALIAGAIYGAYEAWTHNVLGIQDKTKDLANTIGTIFKNIETSISNWVKGFLDAHKDVKGIIDQVGSDFNWLGKTLSNVFSSSLKDAENWARGIGEYISRGAASINTAWGNQVKKMPGWAQWLLGSDDDDTTTTTAKKKTAKAKPVPPSSGIIPGFQNPNGDSAPADTAPEMPGLSDAIENALYGSKSGKKKKAKITFDVDVQIKDNSAQAVEHLARNLENEWARKGTHHKMKWINLIDDKGNVQERTFGDPQAFKEAVKAIEPDNGLEDEVKKYLERVKVYKKGTIKEIDDLKEYLKKAKGEDVRAYIQNIINELDKPHQEALKKVLDISKETNTKTFGENGTAAKPTGGYFNDLRDESQGFTKEVKDADQEYEELQRSWGNGIRTAKELKEAYNLLSKELESLTEKHQSTKDKAEDLAAALKREADQYKVTTGTTQEDINTRNALSTSMEYQRSLLAQYNIELNQQSNAMQNVSGQMDLMNAKYIQAIKNQNDLNTAMNEATQTARNASLTQGGNILASGATSFFNHLDSGSRGGGAVQQMVQGYVSSYIQSMSGPLFKAMFGGATAGTPQQVVDTQGQQLQTQANTHLTTISTTLTQAANTLTSIATNTAASANNSKLFEGLNQNSDQSIPVNTPYASAYKNDAGQADMSNSSFSDWGTGAATGVGKTGKQFTQQTLGATAGALAATYSGAEEGGAQGALNAGIGTFMATGNPYVAAAAAVIGAIGIGSKATPATSPDIYNTQQYGQYEANLLGAGYNGKAQEEANGSYFVEDQATANATNNLGLIQGIQQWADANQYSNDASVAKMAQNDIAQYGNYDPNATTANQIIQYDKNIGNEKVVGGSEAGNYQQIYNDATQASNAIQQLASASLLAAQNATALANSFTANLFGGPSGFSIPYLGSIAAGNASSSFLPTTSTGPSLAGGSSGNGGTNVAQTVTINLLQGATVSNSNDVANAVMDLIPSITNAINQTNYNTGRYASGYVSQLS